MIRSVLHEFSVSVVEREDGDSPSIGFCIDWLIGAKYEGAMCSALERAKGVFIVIPCSDVFID